MLKQIGRALEKNAALVVIKMENCRFGDAGLNAFCSTLTHDSLPNVKHIALSNNFISTDGAVLLANILRRRKIGTLDMKLNPILTEGKVGKGCETINLWAFCLMGIIDNGFYVKFLTPNS